METSPIQKALSGLVPENAITPANIPEEYVTPDSKINRVAQTGFALDYVPKVTFRDVTDVGAYSRYGAAVTPYNDYNRDRAELQTRTQQTFNALKQMGTTVAGEAISGVGSIGGIIEAMVDETRGENADFNNALMEWGQKIQDYGAAKAPIYRENPNASFDVGDFAWWAQNGVSVASSLGLLIPGYVGAELAGKLVSGIGKFSRAANITGKGNKLSQLLGRALAGAGELGQSAEYYTKLGTSAVIMRNGENLKESLQVTNDAYNKVANLDDKSLL